MKNENLAKIRDELGKNVNPKKSAKPMFFKTGPGHYSAHDRFLGVSVPVLRKIAAQFKLLSLTDLKQLLYSQYNEERLLALFILVKQYQTADKAGQAKLYAFYMRNLQQVNNWNLVDSSAHYILGAHIFGGNKDILLKLAKSKDLWEKRISIVATWYFIRNNDCKWTLKIATVLLDDEHDLIHKATGWMLREVGKQDLMSLKTFLDKHAAHMPRTMLRYAIERFPEKQRKQYLLLAFK